jgi:hypothetical protein
MLLEGLVFRLQHFRSDDWELGEECFVSTGIADRPVYEL